MEKKFSEFEEKNNEQQKEFKDLKDEFFKLKKEYEELVKIVLENKDEIKSLFERLDETIKNYKEGDEILKKKIENLKKYTEDKILELNTKLSLLLNNINGGVNRVDLSGLEDFMQKLINLENRFDDFVNKANIDEIYRQLKYLGENKADKAGLEEVKEILNDINKKTQDHQEEIETLKFRLDSLYQQFLNMSKELPVVVTKEEKKEPEEEKDKKKVNEEEKDENKRKYSFDIESLELDKYALKTDLDNYIKENNEEIKKIWEEIRKINELITNLSNTLKEKAFTEDLNELREFLLSKIDVFVNDLDKKYADKNETLKNLKYLEDQIKKLFSLFKSKKEIHTLHEADNWLLAKKPINAFSCVACESYIGDLKTDKNKYVAWNKLPVRDPGDKLYRMGNGFSRMLNMLNFDDNGNASLNRNDTDDSNESESKNESKENELNTNLNININELKKKNVKNIHNKTLLKNRFKSASTTLLKEKKDNNIKLGQKTQNNFFNKEEIKNKYLPKLKKEKSADVLEKIKEEKPKITKIFKKTYNKFHIKE